MHDWTRVDAGIFHGFHGLWIAALNNLLNGGLLPPGFYAYPEQHAGRFIADLILLHAAAPANLPSPPASTGGLAVAEAPPKVRHRSELSPSARARRRTLAIRHVSGHRLVAVLEIVSPSNKDRPEHVAELAGKIDGLLSAGVHVLLVDPFPPGHHDPNGLDAVVREFYGAPEPSPEPDAEEPLTVVAYRAALPIESYLEHFAAGTALPEMPLFFQADRYINVPLEASYMSAFQGVPAIWQEALS
ncbi:MAG TPA: DUF4058 family protein [Pirellulales bacterium]|nr:DUF4058 family protein [Pirellulales bacterium]